MGIVTLGIPQEIVLELSRRNGSTVFVETGTYHGITTRWAAERFETVHTIERAEHLYQQHREDLSRRKGVTPHLGDSREVLPRILEEIGDRSATFWLDGHWSGGDTAGEQDECPLLDELACLSGRSGDVILIDDARLFLSAPPLPHDPAAWPTIAEVVEALPSPEGRPFVQVVDDVLFCIPDRAPLRDRLAAFAQERSNRFWEEFAELQRGKVTSRGRLRRTLSWLKRSLTG